ncbi:hypothetical protein DE146DRAFT_122606 [Phaeosphaeria sp. MPI-PUGE-AT-0046c]|nr:hypothetical protein DE146DRAFT_122606 [Phaeosphaeria sp. MPI-PUGE-AT-0046c]
MHLSRRSCYLSVTLLARKSSTPMMLRFTRPPGDLVETCRRLDRCDVLPEPDRQTPARSIPGSQSQAVRSQPRCCHPAADGKKGRLATVKLHTSPSESAHIHSVPSQNCLMFLSCSPQRMLMEPSAPAPWAKRYFPVESQTLSSVDERRGKDVYGFARLVVPYFVEV